MAGRVLLVEWDEATAAGRAAELATVGYEAIRAADPAGAAEVLMRERVDLIVSDDAARAELERTYGVHIPVVPIDGRPTSALVKTLARLARRSLSPPAQLALGAQLDAALAEAEIAREAIVALDGSSSIWGHRLVLRTPTFAHDDLPLVARTLGRQRDLGRRLRELVGAAGPRATTTLVDCSAEDLLDPTLYDAESQFVCLAAQVVLAVQQRDALDLGDMPSRARELAALGFSLAVRTVAGPAALTSVGVLRPAYALLDMRSVGKTAAAADSKVLRRVIASMVEACREAKVRVIATHVRTQASLAAAREAGCVLAMGPVLEG